MKTRFFPYSGCTSDVRLPDVGSKMFQLFFKDSAAISIGLRTIRETVEMLSLHCTTNYSSTVTVCLHSGAAERKVFFINQQTACHKMFFAKHSLLVGMEWPALEACGSDLLA